MVHCPICGDEVSRFDRGHMRTKHHEYYNESMKLVKVSFLPLALVCISGIFLFNKDVNNLDFPQNLFIILIFVGLGIGAYVVRKSMRLENKFKKLYSS